MLTGQKLWGPVGAQSPWDYFGGPAFDYVMDQVAYGRLYSVAYGGITYCYNLTTGVLLWTYGNDGPGNSTESGFYTTYGNYPMFLQAVGNGVIYEVTTEHTIETPIYKGAVSIAIDAVTGKELWRISDYTGEFASVSYAIADGYSTWFNGYDDQIYVVGRGPSATTITAPQIGVTSGTPIVISGSVTDISSGTTQSAPTADFPHGVPCSSDTSMADWMRYVYQQGPLPTNFTGVTVQLSVTNSQGNVTNIGTATTDATGKYSFSWTPATAGTYTVNACFAGTNGYWPSTDESSVAVMQPPAAATPTPTPTTAPASPVTETYLLGSTVAIIIVIIIIGVVLMLTLRRSKQ